MTTRKNTKGSIKTAHISEIKGKASELTARLALMSNGWIVAKPETAEPFDIVARDPVNGEWATFQVKSVRVRLDRGHQYVIDARHGREGERTGYTQSDADYLIGVLEAEDSSASPRVWMTRNTGQIEYWASESRADRRWHKLPITLDRTAYESADVS